MLTANDIEKIEMVQIHTVFPAYRRLKPIKVGTIESTSSGGFTTPWPKFVCLVGDVLQILPS